MGKKILVTGGTGYIGSHTCVALQQAGYDVVVIDNLCNSELWILDRIERITGQRPLFEKLDLCDAVHLKRFFSLHPDIEGVIHFAALKAVGESTEKPLKYYHNNLTGLINLLAAMQDAKCDRIVFSSSCTVYGQPDSLPVSESAPMKKAQSPYGNTKQVCEDIIEDVSRSGNLKAISLRYFNPIGAHASALIGELPKGTPNNLVPFITQTAAGKRDCVKVFGSDYDTPDGTGIRDYIHVVDLAEAHVAAIERLNTRGSCPKNEVFNLGTGQGYSVLDIIQTFQRVIGVTFSYEMVDRRPGDIEKVWADPTKANSQLRWKAKLGLEDMLRSAWRWEQQLSDLK